jgi:transcriptional regulator with XRE-family HTH domain
MATYLVVSVANAIRRLRRDKQMSQEQLASIAGLDRTYISGVERGIRNITLESLEQIIGALGVSERHFLNLVSDEIDAQKLSTLSRDEIG